MQVDAADDNGSGFRPCRLWEPISWWMFTQSRINRWLTGIALRHAGRATDGFVFVEILRNFGVPEKGILVHTFGTDVHHFCPGPDEGERQVLGVGEAPLVISTRTLNPVHDVETFVRALPGIQATFPSARYVIAGDGTDRVRLEALATELGVSSVTRFTGMVEEDRMRRLLRVSNVYVSTSKMDAGLAASTAEAMAGFAGGADYNSDNACWFPNGEGGLSLRTAIPLPICCHPFTQDAAERRRMVTQPTDGC
jgi:glycosyltransferase involved in cell wall biosynthesis